MNLEQLSEFLRVTDIVISAILLAALAIIMYYKSRNGHALAEAKAAEYEANYDKQIHTLKEDVEKQQSKEASGAPCPPAGAPTPTVDPITRYFRGDLLNETILLQVNNITTIEELFERGSPERPPVEDLCSTEVIVYITKRVNSSIPYRAGCIHFDGTPGRSSSFIWVGIDGTYMKVHHVKDTTQMNNAVSAAAAVEVGASIQSSGAGDSTAGGSPSSYYGDTSIYAKSSSSYDSGSSYSSGSSSSSSSYD